MYISDCISHKETDSKQKPVASLSAVQIGALGSVFLLIFFEYFKLLLMKFPSSTAPARLKEAEFNEEESKNFEHPKEQGWHNINF